MDAVLIDRGFVRISAGLVHYRTAQPESVEANLKRPESLPPSLPLYMAHSGPGSSLGLVPIIAELAKTRSVIAPDMLGNGDSEAPKLEQTDMRFYVDCVVETLDKLGLERVDFYGQHTGAHIGCELALTHPERVGRLILDGIPLFSAELKAEMLARYAPRMEPDDFGGHLAWAWNFVGDLFLHFPYYLCDPEHRLHQSAVPAPAIRQRLVVDLLKALPSYHLAYQAAFNHPMAERLPLLQHDTLLIAADGDPLGVYFDEAAALLPKAHLARVTREQRAVAIQAFLGVSVSR